MPNHLGKTELSLETENFQPLGKEQLLRLSPGELKAYIEELCLLDKFEVFLEDHINDNEVVALLSYWEKWFREPIRKMIDKKVAESRAELMKREDCIPLDLESRFTPEELTYLFTPQGAVQPTFGCSHGCKYCGVDAVPGLREEIIFAQIKNLFERYGKQMGVNEWYVHWASELSDCSYYEELHQLAKEYGGYEPDIVSAEGNDKNWVDYLRRKVSGTLGLSLKEDASLVEEFKKKSLKKSVVKVNGKGVEIKMPTTVGFRRQAHRSEHFPGVGLSLETEGRSEKDPFVIGFITGPLITPRGIYNVFRLDQFSDKFPQGQVVVPIGEISDQPIKIGEPVDEVLRSSLIMDSRGGFSNHGRTKILYRKCGLYEVSFDASWNVERVLPIGKQPLIPLEVEVREKYLLDLRNQCIENVQPNDDLEARLLKWIKENPNSLELFIWEEFRGLKINWNATLPNLDVPEDWDKFDVTFDYDGGQFSFECSERSDGRRDLVIKYGDKVRELIKKQIEKGSINIRSEIEIVDLQAIVDRLYSCDYKYLKVNSVSINSQGEGIRFSIKLLPEAGVPAMEIAMTFYPERGELSKMGIDIVNKERRCY